MHLSDRADQQSQRGSPDEKALQTPATTADSWPMVQKHHSQRPANQAPIQYRLHSPTLRLHSPAHPYQWLAHRELIACETERQQSAAKKRATSQRLFQDLLGKLLPICRHIVRLRAIQSQARRERLIRPASHRSGRLPRAWKSCNLGHTLAVRCSKAIPVGWIDCCRPMGASFVRKKFRSRSRRPLGNLAAEATACLRRRLRAGIASILKQSLPLSNQYAPAVRSPAAQAFRLACADQQMFLQSVACPRQPT